MASTQRLQITLICKVTPKGTKGQSMVEYVILLACFTAVAVVGWQAFRPALTHMYTHLCHSRSDIHGMLP